MGLFSKSKSDKKKSPTITDSPKKEKKASKKKEKKPVNIDNIDNIKEEDEKLVDQQTPEQDEAELQRKIDEEKRLFLEQEEQAQKNIEEQKRQLELLEQQRLEELENQKRVEQEEAQRIEEELLQQERELEQQYLREEEERNKEEARRRDEKLAEIKDREQKLRTKNGYLTKQGHIVKSWKIRYFRFQAKKLLYFEDSTEKSQKGEISLHNCQVKALPTGSGGRENCFLIDTEERVPYILSATSSEDRDDWVEAVRFVSTGYLKGETSTRDFSENKDYYALRASASAKGDRIPKSGWLNKEGHVHKSWRRRWFVLSGSRLTESVIYYDAENSSKPLGEIFLAGSTIEKLNEPCRGRTGFCLLVKTIIPRSNSNVGVEEKKDFYLEAETPNQQEEWFVALNAARDAIKQEKEFVHQFL